MIRPLSFSAVFLAFAGMSLAKSPVSPLATDTVEVSYLTTADSDGDENLVAKTNESIADSMDLATIATESSSPFAPSNEHASDAYPSLVKKIRPSIVLVRTPFGTGTGFAANSNGWIVTNYHVVQKAPWDPVSTFQIVRVYYGRDSEKGFELDKRPLWGRVFRCNRKEDLALIQLITFPEGGYQIPTLPLAEESPPVGSDCLAIGMPAKGLLWTLRTGRVAGHGHNRDVSNSHFRLGDNKQLSATEEKQLIRQIIADNPKGELTLTTCRLTYGDSGGPLMNRAGKVIGVTWGGPPAPYDKFSYHVHLNTLKEFLSPKDLNTRQIDIPSSLPHPTNYVIQGLTSERAESIIALKRYRKTSQGLAFLGYYFNVDGRGARPPGKGEDFPVSEEEFWKRFEIEWAITFDPVPTYFFDRNADGKIDLVFLVTDGAGEGNQVLKIELDEISKTPWKASRADASFLNGINEKHGGEVTFDRTEAQLRFQSLRHKFLPSNLRR